GAVWDVCALPGHEGEGGPDGRTLLATAGYDGTVRVWDPQAGTQVGAPLAGHKGTVLAVTSVPGFGGQGRPSAGRLLVGAGEDGTIRLWDPLTGHPVGAPMTPSAVSVNQLAMGAGLGRDCVAVTGDGTVHTWSSATAALASRPFTGMASAVATSMSADRETLVLGDLSGRLHLIDSVTGARWAESAGVDNGALLAVCPLPDRAGVLAAGSNGVITAHLPEVLSGGGAAPLALRGHVGPVRALCLVQRPGRPPLLASAGNDATIRIWDLGTWAPYGDGEPFVGHDGWIWSLAAFTLPSTTGAAARLASAGADHTIRLWDPRGGGPIGSALRGHTDQVRAVVAVTAADGRTALASGGHDGTVRLWDPATAEPLHVIPLGIPVQALLPQPPEARSSERTGGGATVEVGLRTGILALDLHGSLFPGSPDPG
ncbi:WD40 repeat domain-containing protein, partial [Streptomyces olivochromogenes]|uniref:WD40 repeat domain-containing protein n=1 Tax=Streptomyces olivochromogenes TaxID=1963 RepID=UPI0036DEFDE7